DHRRIAIVHRVDAVDVRTVRDDVARHGVDRAVAEAELDLVTPTEEVGVGRDVLLRTVGDVLVVRAMVDAGVVRVPAGAQTTARVEAEAAAHVGAATRDEQVVADDEVRLALAQAGRTGLVERRLVRTRRRGVAAVLQLVTTEERVRPADVLRGLTRDLQRAV